MFKLTKIINSGVNVPEPCKLAKNADTVIKAGSAVKLSDGCVTNCTATDTPTYIALENATAGSLYVTCFEVTPEMRFEVRINADPSALKIGNKVTLGIDADGSATEVTATTASGVATVTELFGTSSAGNKITVKF